MELIDKSAVVAEIEKKIKQYKNERNTIIKNSDNLKELSSRIIMCQEIIYFLDTLEVKEVDLDEIANHEDIKNAFKAGYELGMSVSNKSKKGE